MSKVFTGMHFITPAISIHHFIGVLTSRLVSLEPPLNLHCGPVCVWLSSQSFSFPYNIVAAFYQYYNNKFYHYEMFPELEGVFLTVVMDP